MSQYARLGWILVSRSVSGTGPLIADTSICMGLYITLLPLCGLWHVRCENMKSPWPQGVCIWRPLQGQDLKPYLEEERWGQAWGATPQPPSGFTSFIHLRQQILKTGLSQDQRQRSFVNRSLGIQWNTCWAQPNLTKIYCIPPVGRAPVRGA